MQAIRRLEECKNCGVVTEGSTTADQCYLQDGG